MSGRAFVVRRLKPLPIEAIARGYIAGSGWKEYQRTGAICGVALPDGMQEAQHLEHGEIRHPLQLRLVDDRPRLLP